MISSIDVFLAQTTKLTSWLSPIWILSIGIGAGFILVLLLLLKIIILSKVPFLNTIADRTGLRWVFGILLSVIYGGCAVVGFYYLSDAANILEKFGDDPTNSNYTALIEGFTLFLIIVLPFCVFLGFGAWYLISKKRAPETLSLFREGFLYWLNALCIGAVLFASLGYGLDLLSFNSGRFVEDPTGILRSFGRLPYGGTGNFKVQVEPVGSGSTGEVIDVAFWGQEVKWIEFKSNQRVDIATMELTASTPPSRVFNIMATSQAEPQVYFPDASIDSPIPQEKIDNIYVANLGSSTADVEVTYRTGPVYPQVVVILWAAAFVLLVYLSYLISATVFPKIFAIAYSTFKTEISQPLFLIVLIVGGVFIVGSVYVPYNTFGEDIKMYKDSGLTLIRVLAIFLAIWAASKSVAEEIEGRTALTVLSKPVGRRQFILGKLFGISLAVALLFIVIGGWFVIWTSYKPVYDAVESSKGTIEWVECFNEAISVIPALFLGFLEVVIFVAISVAISTRFGILANFLICFSIYVLGHLTPLIVQSAEAAQAFETVGFFGQLIAIVFPVLNHFDVQAAINTNRGVPMVYLGWSVIYCALYGAMTMLLALVLFEDRDLA